MIDLIEFLEARLDEDGEVALEAAGRDASRRNWRREYISCVEAANGDLIVYGEGTPTSAAADHIARHDPARVLGEVAAKRAIVEDHAPVVDGTQDSWQWFQGSETTSRRILRQLALAYAAHPDYREEWKP